MTGKKSREKGKRFERHLALIYREVFEGTKRTGWMQSDDRAAPGATAIGDFPDVVAGPLDIEAKHKKTHDTWGAMNQAIETARPGQIPTLVMKRKRGEPVLVVRTLEDDLEIMKALKAQGEEKDG